ncbi:predicted protein [Pyrenophora tritici-repentis Pt-1C-BFP]|uniref:Uncharacterized protein n=1 Tax=Pyrenophora tritici-repentis (strain Pt-1C-BFP) TaxID=426418 RepID=B2W374_PYRTR|nr:uncharacterized protein PTRG_03872 [Pyrenophora tritici-repentis Pt-1C-BFP]EDU46710.1 predicted protein [Pyrenophora tritici-repentis Pt-1C-BFP]
MSLVLSSVLDLGPWTRATDRSSLVRRSLVMVVGDRRMATVTSRWREDALHLVSVGVPLLGSGAVMNRTAREPV